MEEYEGRTEQEAVAKAAAALGSESFDVEILEKSVGLFGRGKVRIRVRSLGSIPDPLGGKSDSSPHEYFPIMNHDADEDEGPVDPPPDSVVNKIVEFTNTVIRHMGVSGTVSLEKQEGKKLIFELKTEHASILIGKKGRNLDALQFLANVYLSRITDEDSPWRILVDAEGYRDRREKSLVRMAHRAADSAVRTRSSRLLEPMNPFERCLVHQAVSLRKDVTTKSEGEGLYKRVRIVAMGSSKGRRR